MSPDTAPGAPAADRLRLLASMRRHQAGLVLVPTAAALSRRGVVTALLDAAGPVGLTRLIRSSRGTGYLRVALRAFASVGWLHEHVGAGADAPTYAVTPKGRIAMTLGLPFHEEAARFMPLALRLERILSGEDGGTWAPQFTHFERQIREGWWIDADGDAMRRSVLDEVRAHADGMVLAPTTAVLARTGVLDLISRGPVSFGRLEPNLQGMFDILATQGWVFREHDSVALTPLGCGLAELASSYGLVASYLPALSLLDSVLGDRTGAPRPRAKGPAALVDRAMHQWASGGVMRSCFAAIDPIVREVFSRPIEEQPRVVCDARCGDGTLLEHVYRVVRDQTPRGALLSEHPLVLVGSDRDAQARQTARRTLDNAGIRTFRILATDVTKPAVLTGALARRGLDAGHVLHLRTFIDQHWPCRRPRNSRSLAPGRSTGAFVLRGESLAARVVEDGLVAHLREWRPFIGRHGLVAVALHTVPSALAAATLDLTASVAYDAIHGYADRFLLEQSVFLDCARDAGFHVDDRCPAPLSQAEVATVSVTYFRTSTVGQ